MTSPARLSLSVNACPPESAHIIDLSDDDCSDYQTFKRVQVKNQDFLGPLVPRIRPFEEDKPGSSQRSTPLEGELTLPELYSSLVNQMDRQRDVLGLMKRKYEAILVQYCEYYSPHESG